MLNINFSDLIPFIFPMELLFIDNGNNVINDCDYPRPNSNGYLVFFKAGTMEMKYIYIGKDDELTQSYIVKLDARGCIPKDMIVYFNCQDDLYDIWVYRESFDVTQDYIPCNSCHEHSLIEILRNQPTYASIYNSNNNTSSTAAINLVQYGEFEKSLINLPSSSEFKENQARYSLEPLTDYINFYYENATSNTFTDEINDYISIKTFIYPEITTGNNPRNYLDLQLENVKSNILVERYLELLFTSSAKFDNKDFVISFYAKYESVLDVENIEIEFKYARFLRIDSVLANPEKIRLTNQWAKYTIQCTLPSRILEKNTEFQDSFAKLYLKINNTFTKANVKITSITVNYGETPVTYDKQQEIFNKVAESTVGKIIDYLWIDGSNVRDRETSIVADGRAVLREDYYQLNPSSKRIPYQKLFDYIGYRFGSGDQFVNAYSLHAMVNNFKSATVLGDVVFQWNYRKFKPEFNLENSFQLMDVFMISTGYDFKENNIPFSIETSFCFNENEGNFSIGYMADSIYKPYSEVNLPSESLLNIQSSKKITALAGLIDLSKNTTVISKTTVFSAKENAKSFGIVGGYSQTKDKDSTSLSNQLAPITAKTYNILYENILGDTTSSTTTNSKLNVLLKLNYAGSNPSTDSVTENQIMTNDSGEYTLNICTNSKFGSTENNNEQIAQFVTKYQLEGKCAYALRVKGTKLTDFRGKYFSCETKYKTNKAYFWFKTTFVEEPPVVGDDPIIPIDLSDNNFSIINVAKRIEEAVNSYLFCVPNLQETILYAVGNGYQTPEYGKEDVTKYQFQQNYDREIFRGHAVPITSQSLSFKNSIFELRGEQCSVSKTQYSTTSNLGVIPQNTLWKQSDPYARTATLRHISLV